MSDYHILAQALDKKTINVVFHIGISGAGTNQAGIQWRDAIVLDAGGAANIESVLPGIDPAELSAMKAGAIYEVHENFRFSSITLTPVQKRDEIIARYLVLKNGTSESILEQKQITLEWIGYENDVP